MSSITPFDSALNTLPVDLRATVATALQQWQDAVTALNVNFQPTPALAEAMVKVWCGSLFVAESCQRKPELLLDLIHSGDLFSAYTPSMYSEKLAAKTINNDAELMAQLRQFRRREMIRIAWRDLAGWAELSETLLELSRLADACINTALDFLYQQACDKRGTPLLADGNPQQIIVLGMGKLGAFELNYSSDIDLIFAYPEDGILPDKKATTYGEFFTKLCQQLVKVLDEITVDGFVFRTDIRLRPFGGSGAIIMTFDGMENYYQTQAREWERYAMIKARQIAGDINSGAQLMAMLKAFVYRRYLDYGAFEELRGLKAQITLELRRKDRLDNIKLGSGGIREIEFIGQAFQLIRGGHEQTLQTRGIVDVLHRLGELGLLTPNDAAQLRQSYAFLRRLENHIQQYQDKQTHDLPTDPQVQQRLSFTMNYADWHSLKTDLDAVRSQVHSVFDHVFSLSKQALSHRHSQQIWLDNSDNRELLDYLTAYQFKHPADSLLAIRQFKQSPALRRLTSKGAGVIERLIPQLIEALAHVDYPDDTLKRMLALFEAVAGRNVYLALLAENPDALVQLLRLASASAWICQYLAKYPVLFDELLDTRSLYEPLTQQDLDAQLAALLAPIDVQDSERLMTVLREFKQLNVLRVAAADIMGVIPVMVVSDYLTTIAETIVVQVVKRAWLLLTEKHGYPPTSDDEATGFAVIGFGKLGGIELGYGSDLDLVFLYDCREGHAVTDGDKPVSCAQFYARLGQKVRHILETRMLSGVLYEVDMRLRPSGDSGLLVAHIASYEDYLQHQAWTWEHQALVRARFIAGDARLHADYDAIRCRILSLPRDLATLKTEVREMREKMRAALATKAADKFDLKHSKGGIADIEFIVQFGVLALAATQPTLTRYTDNVRLLQGLHAEGFITKTAADTLICAYCAYRDYGHKRVLQDEQAIVASAEVSDMSQHVERIWLALMTSN